MLQVVKKNTGIEAIKADAVEATEVFNQFNWDVNETQIFNPNGRLIKGFKSLERSDNGAILNVCKQSYSPVSNEAFSEFVLKLSEITGYEVKSFDEFQNGKKVLAYLKAPEIAINGFPIKNYMCIGNSHDSTSALFVANTTYMIRCENRFSFHKNSGLRISHTSGNNARLKQLEQTIKLYQDQQLQLYSNFNQLQAQTANKDRLFNFIGHMLDFDENFDYSDKAFDTISTRKTNQFDDLLQAIDIEAADLGKNDFALFNGVTRWTSHIRSQKNATFGNLFGSNALLNQKALNYLLN